MLGALSLINASALISAQSAPLRITCELCNFVSAMGIRELIPAALLLPLNKLRDDRGVIKFK